MRRFRKGIFPLSKNLVIILHEVKVTPGRDHGTLHIAFFAVRDCNVRTSVEHALEEINSERTGHLESVEISIFFTSIHDGSGSRTLRIECSCPHLVNSGMPCIHTVCILSSFCSYSFGHTELRALVPIMAIKVLSQFYSYWNAILHSTKR